MLSSVLVSSATEEIPSTLLMLWSSEVVSPEAGLSDIQDTAKADKAIKVKSKINLLVNIINQF